MLTNFLHKSILYKYLQWKFYPLLYRLGLVADHVIQAIGKTEFEDGLRTVVLLEDYYTDASMASALSPWSMLEPL